MKTTLHLLISGRVQGVWYRESMRQEAEHLNISGWVRNRSEGIVEAVVQGEEAAVSALLAWARRGPPAARVDDIVTTPVTGEFSRFERRPTV